MKNDLEIPLAITALIICAFFLIIGALMIARGAANAIETKVQVSATVPDTLENCYSTCVQECDYNYK